MQYWIVKSGTKEVISGPFETQDEANKEMARFPVGGDAKAVTQGNYLGNGLIEAAYDLEKAKEELQDALRDLRDAIATGEDKEVIEELQDEVKHCREVLNSLSEAASFDFSTTSDADILKVSAALEKAGIPFEVEEKGESFVVKVLDSRDQLVASELIGDTMKESNSGLISVFYNGKLVKEFKGNEDLDESEDYSNVVSQHEHRNKSATVFKKGDGFEVVFYRDGGLLSRDFYKTKEEAQSEAKAWVAGGVNESAQLSPFERVGFNPVYSEDGKKATIKIFSECEMDKFNKVVEAYLNTYIESIEYKIEESDDNCLYMIEVRLVQSPETKGDPETMMKELKTESITKLAKQIHSDHKELFDKLKFE